jgi:hypothetical protein
MLIPILVALAVLFIIIVSMRPAEFRVTRKATINGPPAAVFAQVNDFHKWEAWSPWAKLDPNAKNNFEGTPGQVGSQFSWSGNNKVGEGRMTLAESRAPELVRIQLEFIKPFKATNTAEFTFLAQGNQTTVSWSMFGKNNFMSKAVGLFMNCDKMVGCQFEKGLASMKSVVETSTK